jgi:hypothetical protein
MATTTQTKAPIGGIRLGQVIKTNVLTQRALLHEMTLESQKGFRIITITAITDPTDYSKRDNPFWDKANQRWNIKKIATTQGFVYANPAAYARAVNKELAAQGKTANFTAGPRKWGIRLQGSCFIEHTRKTDGAHKFYLEIRPSKSLAWKYVDANTGKDLDAVQLKALRAFEVPDAPDKKQGLDAKTKIRVRDYDLDNIVGVSFDGRGFEFVA